MTPEALTMMKQKCLERLTHGLARLPSTWATIKIYEELVTDGKAKRVATDNPFMRVYALANEQDK